MAVGKPNILIIMTDDLGVDVLRIDAKAKTVVAQVDGPQSVVGPVELPTFSRLLTSGVHFQHAWAHPVCTPTRASLWTAMQPWKTTLGFPTGGSDDLVSETITNEPIQTLAQAMVGYKCALFGKWDLGAAKTPVEWGWQDFAGIFRGGVRPDGVRQYGIPGPPRPVDIALLKSPTNGGDRQKCDAAVKALEAEYDAGFLSNNPDLRNYIWEKDTVGPDGKARPPLGPGDRDHIYITEDQVEDAKRWIQANQGPWCVALCLVAPHDPFHVPPPHTFEPGIIENSSSPTAQEMLVAMVASIDHYLGELFTAIEDQLANTVVIFVSDNGTQDFDPDGQRATIDQQQGDDKGTTGIGGVHVPMIVADGGLMTGGSPCYMTGAPRSLPAPVHIIDIYDTALDIAGLSSSPSNDSVSFAPHINKDVSKPTRSHNFSQMYLRPGPDGATPGIGASVSDTPSKYKLTCELLRDPSTSVAVDRSGNPTTELVFDYEFSYLAPDPAIPGSLKEHEIEALVVNADGTFTVVDLAYQEKILELHSVLSRERPYDDVNSRFPLIKESSFVFPTELIGRPVLIENVETKRYLFSDGSVVTKREAEGGWLNAPSVVGTDANYYNRALWIIRRNGNHFLIENQETKRYLFSTGPGLSKARGGEGGWKAASGFESPKLVGADANYYNRARWIFQPQGSAFLIASSKTKRYVLSDGPSITGDRGAEGGWKAASGFESPTVVGADANYYNRALWLIKPA